MSKSDMLLDPTILSSTPIELTNHEFLESIFCRISELDKCRPVCVSFSNSPSDSNSSDWFGYGWDKLNEPNNADFNSYFSISVFYPDECGNYRRIKKQFACQCVIVFDDVVAVVEKDKDKAQIPWSNIKLPPSWVLETSKGNFQVGYILEEPITNAEEADVLSKAIIRRELCDKGAGGPATRLMRLPFASNTKSNPPFRCQMRLWKPERRYDLLHFKEVYGLNITEQKETRALLPVKANKIVSFADDGNSVWKPKPSINIVLESLSDRGLVKSQIEKGKYEISCPWREEHTDQIDSGACYWEPDEEHPIGSFKCQHAHCQQRNISDLLKFLCIDPEDAYMKDKIFLYPGENNRIVESVEKILSATKLFYQRGSRIVSLQGHKEVSLKEVNIHDLSVEMARISRWYRYDSRSKKMVAIDPASKYLITLLECQNHKHLLNIEGIARQPIIHEDGTISMERGYDPITKLYCSFSAEKFCLIEKPKIEDAQKAVNELRELLEECVFESAEDEAATICAMLTASVRILLPYAPMFLIKAHQSATGKSFLTELISLFATSEPPSPIAFPKNSEECEKLLLSEFLKSPSVLDFDNLTSDIEPHKFLCSALTSEALTGRVLGESRTVTVSTKTLIIANGNNVSPVGDMTRRTIPIHMDSNEEFPACRKFKNPNLLKQVKANREKYVSSALTIISAWIQAGKPTSPCQNLNSFDQWSEWCRQPLLWLGLPDPVSKVIKTMTDDPERVQVGRVFDAIRNEFGEDVFTVKALVKRINESTDYTVLREAIEEIGCFVGDTVKNKNLGWWLKKKVGCIVGGIRLKQVGVNSHTKQPKYQLCNKKGEQQ